jgi:hypothetical protein
MEKLNLPIDELKKFIDDYNFPINKIPNQTGKKKMDYILKQIIWDVSLGAQQLENGTSKITLEFKTKL